MSKTINPDHIKSIILIGLIIGSILFAKMIPVEITVSEGFKEIHNL